MEGLVESAGVTPEGNLCMALSESDLRAFIASEVPGAEQVAEELLGAGISDSAVSVSGGLVTLRHGRTAARLFLEASTLRALDEFMVKNF
jgi:hypothetical protein